MTWNLTDITGENKTQGSDISYYELCTKNCKQILAKFELGTMFNISRIYLLVIPDKSHVRCL